MLYVARETYGTQTRKACDKLSLFISIVMYGNFNARVSLAFLRFISILTRRIITKFTILARFNSNRRQSEMTGIYQYLINDPLWPSVILFIFTTFWVPVNQSCRIYLAVAAGIKSLLKLGWGWHRMGIDT